MKEIGFAIGDKAKTTADGQKQPIVVQQITVSPINRKSTDLTDWRNANRSAEGLIPRRTALYDLYLDYGTTDAQIIACWEKRLDPIKSAPWEFTDKNGQPVEAIQQLLDCAGFDDLLTAIMASKLHGYNMCEPTFFVNDNEQNEFSLYNVPLKNMRPHLGIIANSHIGDEGINIREGIYAKTMLEFGKPDDLGLMLCACMYAIRKRGNESDWAEFIEIFGRGIIDATWDGFDQSQRHALQKAFEDMGGSGVIIRPSGTEVDIKNNTGNANGDLQNKFADKMDSYIAKLFLGATETIDSSKSSGYAQSETHAKQQAGKSETDLNFVRRYLNSRFIKVLKSAGFDTKGGTFVIKEIKAIDQTTFNVHKAMRQDLGVPIDDDFFYEEYGVRKPDNYEALKKQADEAKNEVLTEKPDKKNAFTPQASSEEKSKKPNDLEDEPDTKLGLLRRFLQLFHPAPVLAKTPIAGATTCCGEARTITLSAPNPGFFKGLIKRAWEAKGNMQFDAELFSYTAKTLTDGFMAGWRAKKITLAGGLGFEYDYDDPAQLTAYEMNLFRFAGVKTLYEAQMLNEMFRLSDSFRVFGDTAEGTLNVHNRQWLETEYNMAVAVGESAATYARLLKQVDVFPYWCYKTVGDEKVRHSHELLDDIVLPWSHNAWRYIFPPNGWNCRCHVVPRTKGEVSKELLAQSETTVKAYLGSESFKKSAKNGWGINRGDKAMVFTENQHYTSDYLDAVGKLDDIGFEQYGLKDLANSQKLAQQTLKPIETNNEKELSSFFEGLEVISKRKSLIQDFAGRQLIVNRKSIEKHLNESIKQDYANRHQYLRYIKDIITTPDEVWLNTYGATEMNNYVYIKHFKNISLTVVARLEQDLSLTVKSWYNLEDELLRRGVLVQTTNPNRFLSGFGKDLEQ